MALNVGKENIINWFASKIHILKARIIYSNNNNPPIRIYSQYDQVNFGKIFPKQGDTTLYINVLPNQINSINFNITNPDTSSKYNERTDNLNFVGLQDTFNHTFSVDPTTFILRW